jgi:hypothetical protein
MPGTDFSAARRAERIALNAELDAVREKLQRLRVRAEATYGTAHPVQAMLEISIISASDARRFASE